MSETSRFQNDSFASVGYPSAERSGGRLLSEHESAAIAGVSIDTIRQFRGCGLLEPVREGEEDRFREIDIKTLFYNRTKPETAPPETPKSLKDEIQVFRDTSLDHVEGTTEYTVSPDSGIITHTVYAFPQDGAASNSGTANSGPAYDGPASYAPAQNGAEKNPEPAYAAPASTAEAAPRSKSSHFEGFRFESAAADPDVKPVMPHVEGEEDAAAAPVSQSSSQTVPSQTAPFQTDAPAGTETVVDFTLGETSTYTTAEGKAEAIDVTDAKTANLPVPSAISADHLIEMTKGLREQIQILREERDWLRARVEKLETRSEREQMLLLSESENIRKLIQQSESRISWLRALPWFKSSRSTQSRSR